MKVVIRGGTIDAASFARNPHEFTTQDVLTSLSVYAGDAPGLGPNNAAALWTVATGYPGNTISAIDKKWLDNEGAVITPDPLPDQPNHALLSGITIEKAVQLFKDNRGILITR